MNFQEKRWRNFFSNNIQETFKNSSLDYKGFHITLTPDVSNLKHQGYQDTYTSFNAPIFCTVTCKSTNVKNNVRELVYPDLKLCDVPYYTTNGFSNQGSGKLQSKTATKPISLIANATGWYIDDNSKKNAKVLTFRNKRHRIFQFNPEGIASTCDERSHVNTLLFLQAATGYTQEELLDFYKEIPNFFQYYNSVDKVPRESACLQAFGVIGNNTKNPPTATTVIDRFTQQLFTYKGNCGIEKKPRFEEMQSFHRVEGYILKGITKGSRLYEPGTVITREIATSLDKAPNYISEAVVIAENGEEYTLKRLDTHSITDKLCAEEILYAYYQYLLYLAGIGSAHNRADHSNLILLPIDKIVERTIEDFIHQLHKAFIRAIDENESDGNIVESAAAFYKDIVENTNPESRPLSVYDAIKRSGNNPDEDIMRTDDSTNTVFESDLAMRVKHLKESAFQEIDISQFGRLCAYTTPEGSSAGINVCLCTNSGLDECNFITKPVYKVVDGVVDKTEIIHLSWLDELHHIITNCETELDNYTSTDLIPCTLDGNLVEVTKDKIDYQNTSSLDSMSPTLGLAPLVHCNAAKRATLSVATGKQAMPLIKPSRPYLETGISKYDAGIYRAKDIVQESLYTRGHFKYELQDEVDEDGTVTPFQIKIKEHKYVGSVLEVLAELSAGSILLDDGTSLVMDEFSVNLRGVQASISNTLRRYNLRYVEDSLYQAEDIVFYANDVSVDTYENMPDDPKLDHAIAIGQNVRVLFKTYEGFGYEDSVQVSERFANLFGLCTVVTSTITDKSQKDNRDLFYAQGGLHNFDINGLPNIGTYIRPGDVIINRCVKTDDGITRNKSIRASLKEEGFVISAQITDMKMGKDSSYQEASVILANILILDTGDKLSGWHGNKTVVSRIIPPYELPYFADGSMPDIILNPLGCIARENVGQLNEAVLSEKNRKEGTVQIIEPCQPIDIIKEVQDAEELGIKPMKLYNPNTGEPYPEKAFLGTSYIMRSNHINTSKLAAFGGALTFQANTLQPSRAKQGNKAQKLTEMDTWCLKSHGADNLLTSLFDFQSDAIMNNPAMINSIKKGNYYEGTAESLNGYRLQAYFRLLGINMRADNGDLWMEPINTELALKLSPATNKIDNISKQSRVDISLKNSSVFGGSYPTIQKEFEETKDLYGHVTLSQEIIMPILMRTKSFCNLFVGLKINAGDAEAKPYMASNTFMKSLLLPASSPSGETNKTNCVGFITHSYPWAHNGKEIDLKGLMVFSNNITVLNDFMNKCPKYREAPTNHHITNCSDFFKAISDGKYTVSAAQKPYAELLQAFGGISIVDLSENNNTSKYNKVDKTDDKYLSEDDIEEGLDALVMGTGVSADDSHLRKFLAAHHDPDGTQRDIPDFMTKHILIPPYIFRRQKESGEHLTTLGYVCQHIVDRVTGTETDNVEAIYPYLFAEVSAKPASKSGKATGRPKTLIEEITKHDAASKSSILRGRILAKPVFFSLRTVISVNPKLRTGQCGVPLRQLLITFDLHLLPRLTAEHKRYPNLYDRIKKGSDSEQKNRLIKLLTALIYNDRHKLRSYTTNTLTKEDLNTEYSLLFNEMYSLFCDLSELYPIVLKRDPALHKFSIQGFKFIPTMGVTIELDPIACKSFNADFDGDQMAGYFPQSGAAIREVGDKVTFGQNIINPTTGESIITFEQDMALGLFATTHPEPNGKVTDYIVFDKSPDNYNKYETFKHRNLVDLFAKVELGLRNLDDEVVAVYDNRTYTCTIGRLLFNSMWPLDYVFTDVKDSDKYYSLRFNKTMTKGDVTKAVTEYVLIRQADINNCEEGKYHLFKVFHGVQGEVCRLFDRLKDFGFYMADTVGTTLSAWDFAGLRPEEVDEYINAAEKTDMIISTRDSLSLLTDNRALKSTQAIWNDTKNKTTKSIEGVLKERSPNLYNMIISGARGSIANLNHICGFVGIVTNCNGEELPTPIKGCYMNGLSVEELNMNSYTDRTTKINTQKGTQNSGENTRALVYLAEHLHIDDNQDTCDTCTAESTKLKLWYDLNESVCIRRCREISPDNTFAICSADPAWTAFIAQMDELNSGIHWFTEVSKPFLTELGYCYVTNKDENPEKVELDTTLDKYQMQMLWYRTLDDDYLETVCTEAQASKIKDLCIKDSSLQGASNYIITKDAINYISNIKLSTVGFYTILGCRSIESVCRRCFGYTYGEGRYPACGASDMGYVAADALGESTTQQKLNIHKGGVSSQKNLYSSNLSISTSKPRNLNSEVTDSLVTNPDYLLAYVEALDKNTELNYIHNTSQIKEDSFSELPRIDEEESQSKEAIKESNFKLGTVANNDCEIKFLKIRNVITILAGDIFMPLWNPGIIPCVLPGDIVKQGEPLVRQPALTDVLNSNPETLGLRMCIWYTMVKDIASPNNVAARNVEIISYALTEMGVSMGNANRGDTEFFNGDYYTIDKFNEYEVAYRPMLLGMRELSMRRNKVFTSIAHRDAVSKIGLAVTNKIKHDKSSKLGWALAGMNNENKDYMSLGNPKHARILSANSIFMKDIGAVNEMAENIVGGLNKQKPQPLPSITSPVIEEPKPIVLPDELERILNPSYDSRPAKRSKSKTKQVVSEKPIDKKTETKPKEKIQKQDQTDFFS